MTFEAAPEPFISLVKTHMNKTHPHEPLKTRCFLYTKFKEF